MKIQNPLKINDWEIYKFLTIIFTIQISLLGLIGLEFIGLKLPILRELVAFVYLLFVPGILILRVLRLHKLSNIETLLFSVGLSVSTLMFLGCFINILYPFIPKPLSLLPLIIMLSLFVLLMSILSYLIDRDFADPDWINFKSISNQSLFLCFIFILSILGSLILYFYNKNTIFMLMIILIGVTVFLVGFKRFITPKYYPLTIFVISISLLFHTWLLSPYIVGRDIFTEVSVSNFILNNTHWDINLPYTPFLLPNTNSMLIITIFAPIIAKVSNITIVTVYKLIFPLLISLTPLGLYRLFEKQTNERIAFLSAFFFVIMGFYDVFLVSVKQSMAIFFIALLIMCFLRKKNMKITVLSVLFMISIVVSHYGTTYLFIFCFFVGGLIIWLIKNQKLNNLVSEFIVKFYTIHMNKKKKIVLIRLKNILMGSINSKSLISYFFNYKNIKFEQDPMINLNFTLILLFVTFSLAWYIYISDSSVLTTILGVGGHIYSVIFEDFLSPQTNQGLGLILTSPTTLSGSLQKALILIIQLFILLGLFKVFFKDKMKFKVEFMALVVPAILLDIFSVILPNFSNVIYTPRLYSITLIFLAPFALIGGIYLFDKITVFIHLWEYEKSIKLLSMILIILFLLQVGFVKEIVNDPGTSVSLSKEQMMNSNVIDQRANFYFNYGIFGQNYYSINWLSSNMKNFSVYSDKTTSTALLSYNVSLILNWKEYQPQNMRLNKFNYVYLSYSNVKGELWVNLNGDRLDKALEIQKLEPLFDNMSEIYSNGGSKIFYT